MPVISCNANIFEDEKELYSFLLACQNELPKKGEEKIISFSQKIDVIDPLAVMAAVNQPHQLSCYWENRRQQQAIAAFGAVRYLSLNSVERFLLAKKFIENCWQKTMRIGDFHLPGANPYFFCSFSFFTASSPLNSPFPGATIFLPRFQVSSINNQSVLVTNISINKQINLKLILEQIKEEIYNINWASRSLISLKNNPPKNWDSKFSKNSHQFKSAVISALKSIQKNKFSKIVIAHAIDVIARQNFDLIESLNNLRQFHPDCYVFSLSNGQGQYFIGASPERLISIKNKQLITDALAGSAPRGKNTTEDTFLASKLLGSSKERREHQAVSKFLMQRLFQLGLQPEKSKLQLLKLSNIQHLWTPIYAQIPTNVNPLDVVAQLHPTPAVAGVPREIACEQIRRYETFDRSLYAAPLGWIDYQGDAEFIVGIRSALISGNTAKLYAGAGIVFGSNPNQEFAEVQLKLQSLLKALA